MSVHVSMLYSLYLSPTEQFCLKVYTQTKDEGSTHDCQPGQQPQPLGQTHPPLLGELHLQQHHVSLPHANQHKYAGEKNKRRKYV